MSGRKSSVGSELAISVYLDIVDIETSHLTLYCLDFQCSRPARRGWNYPRDF